MQDADLAPGRPTCTLRDHSGRTHDMEIRMGAHQIQPLSVWMLQARNTQKKKAMTQRVPTTCKEGDEVADAIPDPADEGENVAGALLDSPGGGPCHDSRSGHRTAACSG